MGMSGPNVVKKKKNVGKMLLHFLNCKIFFKYVEGIEGATL